MKSKQSIIQALDRYFLKYFKTVYNTDNCVCGTCGKVGKMTLGHYISRAHLTTRWLIQNVHPQCHRCNSFMGGEQYAMRRTLVKKYGEPLIREIEDMALARGKLTKDELLDLLNKAKKDISLFDNMLEIIKNICYNKQ